MGKQSRVMGGLFKGGGKKKELKRYGWNNYYMEHGSQAGEPAASDTMTIPLEVTSVYWPG